jgi:hypothetical protein
MPALDFPASPTVGQLFAAPNGAVYEWTAGGFWHPAFASPAASLDPAVVKLPDSITRNRVQPAGPAWPGMVLVPSGASQTADLLSAEDSAGTVNFAIGPDGALRLPAAEPARVATATIMASIATVDLTGLADHQSYLILLKGLIHGSANDQALNMRWSTDDGGSWLASANYYTKTITADAAMSITSGTAVTTIALGLFNTAAVLPFTAALWFYPGASNRRAMLTGTSTSWFQGTPNLRPQIHAAFFNVNGRVNAVRLYATAGNISGGVVEAWGFG